MRRANSGDTRGMDVMAKRAAEDLSRRHAAHDEDRSAVRPALARAEIVDKATRARFEAELDGALKRRPLNEARLMGALRAIAPMSQALRAAMGEGLAVLIKRRSLSRELYCGSLRALAELQDRHAPALLRSALANEDAGGAAALSAACFLRDATLAAPLAKIAGSRQSHLAFGAELARVARGESNGAHLAALAPMIKESHRISMCVELFVPLARGEAIPAHVGPALTVLRGAERHLGRWLLLGEVAVKAGDTTPIEEARAKASVGPSSARSAWSLVLWALTQTAAEANARFGKRTDLPAPLTRPTLELVARLSDRPSADRDTTFLFRMARAKASVAKPMLEALGKQLPIVDEVGVRAALYLARDYGRDDLLGALLEAATTAKREELRGLAAAALWDAGMRDRAREIADDLVASRVIGNVAWGALIRAASRKTNGAEAHGGAVATPLSGELNGAPSGEVERAEKDLLASAPLVVETPFRWIQLGWLE